jgi:general secretion pathway protein A
MRIGQGNSAYLDFFGLSLRPFAMTPDPRFFLQSRSHLEVLASLVYGVRERKGFVLLTGQVGIGKTTVLRTLLENIDPNVVFSHIINTDVNSQELLQMVCSDFGLPIAGRNKVELINDLFDFLVGTRLEGKNALIVVDEAQNLPDDVLESLRMLSNLETPRDKLLQIILCGQPELRTKLLQGSLQQLAQRIVINITLQPLSPDEAERYVYHRMQISGAEGEEVFPKEIAGGIARLSRGVPRLINILCDNCLMLAYSEGRKVVTRESLDQASAQCLGLAQPAPAGEVEDGREKDVEESNGGAAAKVLFKAKRLFRRHKRLLTRLAVVLGIIILVIISGIIAPTG